MPGPVFGLLAKKTFEGCGAASSFMTLTLAKEKVEVTFKT